LIERYNPATGVALDDAHKLCQTTAAQILAASFQIEEPEAGRE
jgi:hypothetical protein